MSLPSHRLPPPVSQTVGGAAAAAVDSAARTDQLDDKPVTESDPVADSHRQAKVLRQLGQEATSTAVVDPSVVPANRPMMPAKQSTQATKTTAVAADVKRTGSDLPRPMRPQSALKYYMKYLTPYEHQEIFNYPQVVGQRVLRIPVLLSRPD